MNTTYTIIGLLVVYVALVAVAGLVGGLVLMQTVVPILGLPIGILAVLAWLDI